MKLKSFLKMGDSFEYIEIFKNRKLIYFGFIVDFLNDKSTINEYIQKWSLCIEKDDFSICSDHPVLRIVLKGDNKNA